MVVIKLSGMLSTCTGKLSGNVYRRSRTGSTMSNYFYRNRHPKNPQNIAFIRVRNVFVCMNWTQCMIDFWFIYIRQNPVKNRNGEIRYLTIFQMFLKVNIPRLLVGQDIVYCPF